MLFGASLSYELELVTLRLCRTPLFVDNTNMVWIPIAWQRFNASKGVVSTVARRFGSSPAMCP